MNFQPLKKREKNIRVGQMNDGNTPALNVHKLRNTMLRYAITQ